MEPELLRIYTLLKAAEDQFTALKQVITDLSAERAAFAKERAQLEKTLTDQAQGLKMAAASLKAVGVAIRQDATQITPALQEAVQEAVGAALSKTLSLTTTRAVEALKTASEPILERLAGVTQAASAAEATIKNAGRWFAWKWVALVGGSVMGILVTAVLTLKLLEQSHWRSLQAQQGNLLQTIARLQATAEALEKRTYGLYLVTGSDGVFLVTPKGTQTTQCKAGPCIRLQDAAR